MQPTDTIIIVTDNMLHDQPCDFITWPLSDGELQLICSSA